MTKTVLAIMTAAMVFAAPALAGPADEATATVTRWIDKFSAGDFSEFHSTHVKSPTIVDEFVPMVWTGPDASRRWLDDYVKNAEANGISGGHMQYAAPIRAEAHGDRAYIVLPTIYRITQDGKSKSAAGTMTFVMAREGETWKIASWTYSAPEPR